MIVLPNYLERPRHIGQVDAYFLVPILVLAVGTEARRRVVFVIGIAEHESGMYNAK